ncbi:MULTISPECIES: fimbrial protein [Providencia]|uniref:fimbrial protein n=1 Tax=Providencia TaxID=586 RepID=UPI0018A74677|nr:MULTISPECIES: fimbrial protein [Providencia]
MASFVKRITAGITLLALCSLGMTVSAATVSFSANIGSDTTGCSMLIPDSTLNFRPLKANDLTGGTTTYQIKPIQIVLFCTGTDDPIIPSLSVTGNTPYASTSDTVFLDGVVNGVGFMVRQSDGSMPSQVEYYSPADAVVNSGTPMVMNTLDSNNGHYSEEVFWIGLVGPLGDTVVPGPFSATLIVNIIFQ